MSSYGLKTNIAINTAVIVLSGMLLTAFMIISLVQQTLIQCETEKGLLAISAIEELCLRSDKKDPLIYRSIRTVLYDAGVSEYAIHIPQSSSNYVLKSRQSYNPDLKSNATEAFLKENAFIKMTGNSWGVFWRHNKNLQISAPVYDHKAKIAGICIVIPLRPVFQKIRKILNVIFIYILINAGILTFAGVYQISKSAVKPLHRLLKRASEYHAENAPVIFEEKTDNEFKQLSSALNNMLGRISDDKRKLQKSVDSLEDANRDLKKAQNDIVRAEKLASVGRLSSGIAHEIGNPLGIVSGYLELIKDEALGADQKNDFINRAESEIQRIDRIIRQLLDYSRKSKESTTTVKINDVITDVSEMLRVQPFMNGIEISVIETVKNINVQADSEQLKQVLLNLSINSADAINAIKGKRDGYIKIDIGQTDNNMAVIHYKDNGSGISESDISNVFDPFFTTKEPGKGTGLGLSVCFMIIEGFKGTLAIQSELNVGTILKIELPLAENLQEPEATNKPVIT